MRPRSSRRDWCALCWSRGSRAASRFRERCAGARQTACLISARWVRIFRHSSQRPWSSVSSLAVLFWMRVSGCSRSPAVKRFWALSFWSEAPWSFLLVSEFQIRCPL